MAEKVQKLKDKNQKNFNYYYAIPAAVLAGGLSALFVHHYNKHAALNEDNRIDYSFKGLYGCAKAGVGYLTQVYNDMYKYVVNLNPWSKEIPDVSKFNSEETKDFGGENTFKQDSNEWNLSLLFTIDDSEMPEFKDDSQNPYAENVAETVVYSAYLASELYDIATVEYASDEEGNSETSDETSASELDIYNFYREHPPQIIIGNFEDDDDQIPLINQNLPDLNMQNEVDVYQENEVCLALIEYSESYPQNEVLAKLFDDIANNSKL